MGTDTVEFWDKIWSTMDHTFADFDELLAERAANLSPGRALDLGCGSGGNAVWLAQRGWQVTAVDFSKIAIAKGKARAADRRVRVEFVAADVTAYRPNRLYNLIISFYIQLWPEQRERMLSNAANALAPGGRLLFVSHDRSTPPSGWSREDLESLTSPQEVASELNGLRIERAEVVEDTGAHAENMPVPVESEECDSPEQRSPLHGATTLVLAVKD